MKTASGESQDDCQRAGSPEDLQTASTSSCTFQTETGGEPALIQLALAGYGLIGKRHAQAILANPRCELAAIVDPALSPDAEVGCPVRPDLESLDARIEGIILATPTGLHHAQALHALSRGWHVLVEKPIAASVEEAEDIAQASNTHTRQVLVGHHRRHHPRVQVLKQLLEGEVIGAPVSASMMWGVKKPAPYFEDNWRSSEEGSPILINSVHDIDLLRYVLGEIQDIKGFGQRGVRSRSRTETAAFVVQFENGCLGTLTVSDTTPGPWGFELGVNENPNIGATGQDMLFISGTKGAVSFPSMTVWSGSEDWSTAPRPKTIDCTPGVPLDLQLNHFLDIIAGNAAPLIDARDGMRTLAATLSLQHQSLP